MLIPNWRAVLARAWSVWLMALLILVQGLDILLQLVGARLLPFGPIGNAVVIMLVAIASIVARIVLQRKLRVEP